MTKQSPPRPVSGAARTTAQIIMRARARARAAATPSTTTTTSPADQAATSAKPTRVTRQSTRLRRAATTSSPSIVSQQQDQQQQRQQRGGSVQPPGHPPSPRAPTPAPAPAPTPAPRECRKRRRSSPPQQQRPLLLKPQPLPPPSQSPAPQAPPPEYHPYYNLTLEASSDQFYDILGELDPYKITPKEFINLLVLAAVRDEEIARALLRLNSDRIENPATWRPQNIILVPQNQASPEAPVAHEIPPTTPSEAESG